jgi:hypothetical protein
VDSDPPDETAMSGSISKRFALMANGLGLIAAYTIELPLKWYGLTPPAVTWLDALLGPFLCFAFLASVLILPTSFPRHEGLCILGPSAVVIAAAFTLIALERGW